MTADADSIYSNAGNTASGKKVFRPAGVAKLSLEEGGGSQAAEPAKRVRNLKKKLTQIQQLREKKESGAALEAEQQAKLDSEASILQELQTLGESL